MSDSEDNELEDIDLLRIGDPITLKEAAEYCGLSPDSLRDYALRGRIQAKRLGNTWMTTKAAIDSYMASRYQHYSPRRPHKNLKKRP